MRTPDEVYRSLQRRRALVAQCPGRHSAALDLAVYVDRYLEAHCRAAAGADGLAEQALRDLMLCVAPQRAAEEDARAELILRRIRAAERERRERSWWRRLLRAVGIGAR